MKVNNVPISCGCPKQSHEGCTIRNCNGNDSARPLSRICGGEKLKVCKIDGDRKLCARMAQLGVLPGSEIELICPARDHNCMVRIKGSTVSLDQLSAEHILVEPA